MASGEAFIFVKGSKGNISLAHTKISLASGKWRRATPEGLKPLLVG